MLLPIPCRPDRQQGVYESPPKKDCCCDRCDEVEAGPCPECCRCIPRRLCAEGGVYCECTGGVTLEDDLTDGVIYTGEVTCNDDTIALFVEIAKSEYGVCQWIVRLADAYDTEVLSFPIGEYGQSCNSPSLDISGIFGCDVVLIAEDRVTLPLTDYEGCFDYFCGTCKCICRELCVLLVEFGAYGDSCTAILAGDDAAPGVWSGMLGCESGPRAVTVTLYADDYTGECLADVSIEGRATETFPIDTCGDAFGFATEDADHLLVVSCAECGACFPFGECPCCPADPSTGSESATIIWTPGSSNDCGFNDPLEQVEVWNCGFLASNVGGVIEVRVTCDNETGELLPEYKSASGEYPCSALDWTPAEFDVRECPGLCVDGVTEGYLRFPVIVCCTVSGGGNVEVAGTIEVFIEGFCE